MVGWEKVGLGIGERVFEVVGVLRGALFLVDLYFRFYFKGRVGFVGFRLRILSYFCYKGEKGEGRRDVYFFVFYFGILRFSFFRFKGWVFLYSFVFCIWFESFLR